MEVQRWLPTSRVINEVMNPPDRHRPHTCSVSDPRLRAVEGKQAVYQLRMNIQVGSRKEARPLSPWIQLSALPFQGLASLTAGVQHQRACRPSATAGCWGAQHLFEVRDWPWVAAGVPRPPAGRAGRPRSLASRLLPPRGRGPISQSKRSGIYISCARSRTKSLNCTLSTRTLHHVHQLVDVVEVRPVVGSSIR